MRFHERDLVATLRWGLSDPLRSVHILNSGSLAASWELLVRSATASPPNSCMPCLIDSADLTSCRWECTAGKWDFINMNISEGVHDKMAKN